MQRKLIIISALLPWFLSGCISNGGDETEECKPTTIVESKPIIHPDLPKPVLFKYNDSFIITKETIREMDDNVVFQAFEFDDGQQLGVDLNNLKSYVRQLTSVLCSYRAELKEDICLQYLPNEEENQNLDERE